MNSTTRIALLSFCCGGLLFSLGARFVAPFLAPPPRTAPPLHWERKVDQFQTLGRNRKLVFLGDSRIEEALWPEWLQRNDISNRGINGDNTLWLFARLPVSVSMEADVIVLQLGINDLMRGDSELEIVARMSQILDYLRRKSPKIVFTSVIYAASSQSQLKVTALNRDFRALAEQKKLIWVDLNDSLAPRGYLDSRHSNDGLHLNGRGYQIFSSLLRKHL
ncbi:Lysophospholipase L1 [Abditibacterium utsteinense]|uniref:Lysophospholipase L1 n=1 Tax=Abditibacterium utsteinense TaxID=1960156 RepID=A0A2S8SWV1_9BACT|nr:GDSL-type esterase/lipase family protein [Abditibacterium utsteinense]PQV65229.1 Lysophospholipase L1 [Abditibacterium utsteinense]